MAKITLEMLISELKEMIPTLQYSDSFVPYYEYNDMGKYEKWLAAAKRFLSIHFPNDKYVLEFEGTSKKNLWPDQQNQLLAILEALASMPTVIPVESKAQNKRTEPITINNTINNSNRQSQSQEQSIALNMFLEAIKDNLTGKQVKEIKEILTEAANDKEQARKSIIEKLKSFGSDVASNIVANIITNPMIWSCL